MTNGYAENIERLASLPLAMKQAAAAAMAQGHPILKEAGLTGAVDADAFSAGRARLESIGAGAARLEAIVRMVGRPPLLVTGSKVKSDGVDLPDFGADIFDRIRAVEPLIGSVGRIEFLNHDMDWGGTGWVIDRDGPNHLLVVTNRHVAKLVARRTAFGSGSYLFDPASGVRYGAQIDFNEEVDAVPDQARVAPVEGFTYLAADDAADVAIARIAVPAGFAIEPLPLGDGSDGEPIAVVGYPARDSRNDPTHMERYFRGLYDVKRFAPGFLRAKAGALRLSHDATTLGGNSGSPLISLASGKAVGLHFAGKFGIGNSAVRSATLRDVLAGRSTAVAGAGVGGGGDTEGRDGEHGAADFSDRPGYDPAFLEHFSVPMPDPSAVPQVTLLEPSDARPGRKHELRYQHFGVLYCGNYRSPVIAAANLDGAQSKRVKRASDRWFYDLRIPKDVQIGSEAYSDAGVDRGHMVRREDPNWGADQATVLRANFDTFHFTNCSPQHGRFNRNIATWRGLEDYLLDSTRTHGFRACVFTGPVLDEDLSQIPELRMFLPREYWKVVVMPVLDKDADGDAPVIRPHATAYLLSQGQLIQKLLQDRNVTEAAEGFAFAEYKTFQVPIATLETLTGIDFGDLRQHDPLARRETESARPVYVAVEDLRDLEL